VSEYCGDTHCVTCSDEALAMRVLGVGGDGLASCIDDDGRWIRVMTELVGDVGPGDVVLAHAGVALLLVAPEEVAA
jgi:hydrogenase expression/formation protein HypC